MVTKSGRNHQCAKIGFTDLTGMVSYKCIRLSRNSEGFTLHLFPLKSPNRRPISEKLFKKKEKALSEIDRKGLSTMMWYCLNKQRICAHRFTCMSATPSRQALNFVPKVHLSGNPLRSCVIPSFCHSGIDYEYYRKRL